MKILGWLLLLPMIALWGFALVTWIKEHDLEEIWITFGSWIIIITLSLMAGYGIWLIIN